MLICSCEEMQATQLRALLQRDKVRDIFDLGHTLEIFENLDIDLIVKIFGDYLKLSDLNISRAQAQQSMSTIN